MSIWTELSPLSLSVSYVDAGGVPTRSLRAGSGEPVVFLHGTSGHLEAFTRNLTAHAARYECHAIDMLGHGYTGKPDYPYEIPRYVDHLLAYFDAVGIERAHIVGESLGGWVGGRTAIDHPDRVASLQLLCAGGTVANPEVMNRIRTSTREAVVSDDVELTIPPTPPKSWSRCATPSITSRSSWPTSAICYACRIWTPACATSSAPTTWPRSPSRR
jgi:2-hydroxy-6-oxonona-2,4-dienedioate hydrolase